MFQFPHVQSSWDRSATNGFRCVRYPGGERQPEKAFRQVRKAVRDYTKEKPVADDVYEIYKNQFSYDPIELDAIIEKTDDQAPQWTKQKVTFNAAYPNERVIAYLYLPKNVASPYQAVVYYTGSGAIARGSSEKPGNPPIGRIDFLVKSGRALVFPIYRGTFERNEGLKSTWPDKSYTYVDYATKWIKDFKRTIDYLETRDDIDVDRLAYLGTSWGGRMGAIIPAVEPRLKVAVLHLGGLAPAVARPEVDQINFVTRVTIPVLMLNGRYDPIENLETAQIPMFRLLGTPQAHKRHMVYETFHGLPRNDFIKETLDWLDRYLGAVN